MSNNLAKRKGHCSGCNITTSSSTPPDPQQRDHGDADIKELRLHAVRNFQEYDEDIFSTRVFQWNRRIPLGQLLWLTHFKRADTRFCTQ